MAGENETIVLDVKQAVDALREKIEKYGKDSAEYKEMVDKTAKAIEKDEKAHAEFIAKIEAEKKAREEMEERLKDMEAEMVKASSYPKDRKDAWKEAPEYKALQNYVRFGDADMDQEELKSLKTFTKTMRMDDDTQGGYLTTNEFDNQIIKYITEISPVRQVARVKKVSKKTLDVPVRKTIPTATYEGEAAAGNDDNSTYGSEQLTTYRLTVTVPFTMDLLMDANFDLESEINSDVSESMAQKEGYMFVNGTGSKQPEGFLQHADVISGARTGASSLTISPDDLILLTGDLKRGYNPMYGFNRGTLAFLRTLKGSDNHYLWQAGLAPNVPNTLNGEPYIIFQDMPTYNVANNLAVIYADFRRGYMITDRTGTIIIRDQYAKKRQAIIEMTFHRWNHGQVLIPEAFKALKIKA